MASSPAQGLRPLIALGSVVLGALGAIAAYKQIERLEEASLSIQDKTAPPTRKRSQPTKQRHPFGTQPRGLHWWADTSDSWTGKDELPRALQCSEQDALLWESLPVHSLTDDPFRGQENFVEALVASKKTLTVNLEQIMRDIPRTFPEEDYFQDTDVQDTMRRVLMAISIEYPEVGYVQSMNFIVAFLLLHSKTEDACFALFRLLMSHPKLKLEELYKPGLPLLFKVIDALKHLVEHHAPELFNKLKQVGLDFLMFSQTWIMTLFTYNMDWSALGPVWDLFFERGWEGPLRVCLYLICENANAILQGDFDSISSVLRESVDNAPLNIAERSLTIKFDDVDISIIASVVA